MTIDLGFRSRPMGIKSQTTTPLSSIVFFFCRTNTSLPTSSLRFAAIAKYCTKDQPYKPYKKQLASPLSFAHPFRVILHSPYPIYTIAPSIAIALHPAP